MALGSVASPINPLIAHGEPAIGVRLSLAERAPHELWKQVVAYCPLGTDTSILCVSRKFRQLRQELLKNRGDIVGRYLVGYFNSRAPMPAALQQELTQAAPTITSLTLNFPNSFRQQERGVFRRLFQRVQEAVFQYKRFPDLNTLQGVATRFTRVTTIVLKGRNVSGRLVQDIVTAFPGLQSFSIEGAKTLTATRVEAIYRGLNGLTKLALINCPKLTDSIFIWMPDGVRQRLTHLDIRQCAKITHVGISRLTDPRHAALRHLTTSHFYKIEEVFNALRRVHPLLQLSNIDHEKWFTNKMHDVRVIVRNHNKLIYNFAFLSACIGCFIQYYTRLSMCTDHILDMMPLTDLTNKMTRSALEVSLLFIVMHYDP